MQIHNHGNNPQLHVKADSAKPSQPVESAAKATSGGSVDDRSMIDRLENDAEVRERLLVEIKAKVQAGEYMTRVAAEEAASRMVE